MQTTEDTLAESDETFTASISNLTGGGGPAPALGTASVTTTITDDDAAPTAITLSVDPDSIGEDDSATTVSVTATLDGDSTFATSTVVTITLGGSATRNTDYAASDLASVTIPANSATGTATLTITPTDDSVVEGNETITIDGDAGSLTVIPATITLTDDDKDTTTPGDLDSAVLSISGPTSDSVSEGSDATFTVTLSASVAAEVSVAWSAPLWVRTLPRPQTWAAATGTVTFVANSAAGATQTIVIGSVNDIVVGDFGDVHGDAGYDHIGAVLTGVYGLQCIQQPRRPYRPAIPITVNVTGPIQRGRRRRHHCIHGVACRRPG